VQESAENSVFFFPHNPFHPPIHLLGAIPGQIHERPLLQAAIEQEAAFSPPARLRQAGTTQVVNFLTRLCAQQKGTSRPW